MKIAIVGDPHISTGFRARIDDYLHTTLDKIVHIAKENDAVIFLGDMFDTCAMPTYVFNETYKALKPFQGKLHTILGNHDMFHRNVKSLQRTTIGSLSLTGAINLHIDKPFEIDNITFVPVMVDVDFNDIPRDDTNTQILLAHKYYEMMVCPEESLDNSEIKYLNYKYVFLGHDHQPYTSLSISNSVVFRPGSLTRITIDNYNKDRVIRYYQLDTTNYNIEEVEIPTTPSEEVYLKGSFDKIAKESKTKTDMQSLSKLLARFDRKQVSKLSLEEVIRRINGTEEQIAYIRELHRMHNISYN